MGMSEMRRKSRVQVSLAGEIQLRQQDVNSFPPIIMRPWKKLYCAVLWKWCWLLLAQCSEFLSGRFCVALYLGRLWWEIASGTLSSSFACSPQGLFRKAGSSRVHQNHQVAWEETGSGQLEIQKWTRLHKRFLVLNVWWLWQKTIIV